MEKIRVDDMHLHYGDYHALRGVSISFSDREITALIGPSGCGKSTLLKSLNRMNDLVGGCRIQGRILLDGQDIYDGMDVNLLRKRVGMVFQKPNPFPMSVYDNIAYGPVPMESRTGGSWTRLWSSPCGMRPSGGKWRTG